MSEPKKTARELREAKQHLRDLCAMNRKVIAALDAEMKKPSDHERGKRVGQIVHALEVQTDMARHFALKEAFPLKRP